MTAFNARWCNWQHNGLWNRSPRFESWTSSVAASARCWTYHVIRDTLDIERYALVVQWIERLATDQKVGGSNPSGRTGGGSVQFGYFDRKGDRASPLSEKPDSSQYVGRSSWENPPFIYYGNNACIVQPGRTPSW